ncbi:TonB-dependent receptor domain-containing protein [Novosphingobium aquae]|uniref:TonB-dependent receptor n=1 Tax=Novosphingobium aquae TaxID=3133435 RepID=A0ABU8SCR6_9SPHN
MATSKAYSSVVRRKALNSTILGTALLLTSQVAIADEADANGAEEQDKTIVVTGTLIRGVAPTGSNVIGVSAEDVQLTGAATTNQLLQTIPQMGAFGALQFPTGFGNSVTINRPNLRNLPGVNTAGGSSTLVLMDGHRMVGMGITSASPDPDVIPSSAIERLEVVPDGGSAVYGSDAVAGVLNFTTRKKFDGIQLGGKVGFADSYTQYTADGIVGKDWGSGGIYLSYSFVKNDNIRGIDRDFVQSFPIAANGLLPLNCNPGNIQITVSGVTTNYGLPSRAATPTTCDISDAAVFYPSQERHSLLAGFTQDLSDALTVDIKAFFTNRNTGVGLGEFHPGSTTRTTASPFFAANRIGAETSHAVTYSFGGTTATDQRIKLNTWGFTPTFTYKLGENWQLKLLGSYSESDTESHTGHFNNTALTNAINAGLFNPYAPNSSDPAAVAIIRNFETFGKTRQTLSNVRAVLDGELFKLPGGGVKLAVGGEWYHEGFNAQFGDVVPGAQNGGAAAQLIGATTIAPAVAGLPIYNLGRNVKSAFGEMVVPIFGADNAMGGFQELRLSVAGRYDDYGGQIGDTFNPKIGLTWKPIDALTLRGNWGKSFNAPSLADAPQVGGITFISRTTAQFGPTAAQVSSGAYPAVPAGAVTYLQRGNAPGIQPQKAKTWSFGADLAPADGIKLSATYYNIRIDGLIDLPNTTPSIAFADYPHVITLNPSLAFLDAFVASSTTFNGAPCHRSATPCTVYAFVDLAKNNQGNFKLQGIDFSANVRRELGFGTLLFDVNANYEISREQSTSPARPFTSQHNQATALPGVSQLRARTSLGLETGGLLAQLSWNHTAGYDLKPAAPSFVPQTSVESFNVFNLFFRYETQGEGLFKDLSFTLNVDNVFDTDPPVWRLFDASRFAQEGYNNGNTIGRFVQVGVSKKF